MSPEWAAPEIVLLRTQQQSNAAHQQQAVAPAALFVLSSLFSEECRIAASGATLAQVF
jgi:hypothetical protein